MTNETTSQRRAVCPACFAEQAITSSGRLVAHGYTRPQSWNANIGTCHGAGLPHFGLEAGRDTTAEIAARLRTSAAATLARSAAVLEGSSHVEERSRLHGTRVFHMVRVENPTPRDRERFAAGLKSTAAVMVSHAIEMEASVAAWAPREPRIVAVERKGPIMHWLTTRGTWGPGKACAASYSALHVGAKVSEIERVTCARCLAAHARKAASATAAK